MDTCGRYRTAIKFFPPAIFISYSVQIVGRGNQAAWLVARDFLLLNSDLLLRFPSHSVVRHPTTLLISTPTNIVIPEIRGYARVRILYSYIVYFVFSRHIFFFFCEPNKCFNVSHRTYTVVS